jgi:AraC-like DNA-binding protein
MIVAPIEDRTLQSVVRRAALPEEDVFHGLDEVRSAVQFGYPRLLVCRTEDQRDVRYGLSSEVVDLPILGIGESALRSWEAAWELQGLALRRVDDSALRLRALMEQAAQESSWVEAIYSDLTQMVSRGLPPEFRGFSRRILEFPIRYDSLKGIGTAFGLSAGALKARFRRRGLPSPSKYLRWFRLLAAARVLSDPGETILSASFRLGFASDGNFCRWVRATSGMAPSELRDWNGRLLLLVRMAEECLPDKALGRWESFGGLFLRQVA